MPEIVWMTCAVCRMVLAEPSIYFNPIYKRRTFVNPILDVLVWVLAAMLAFAIFFTPLALCFWAIKRFIVRPAIRVRNHSHEA